MQRWKHKDAEMEALPKTEDNIPPHLCVLRQGGKVTSAFVVGDTVAVHVTKGRVTCELLTLMALYYVFDMSYPKCHAMLLGFMQVLVFGEPFPFHTFKKLWPTSIFNSLQQA